MPMTLYNIGKQLPYLLLFCFLKEKIWVHCSFRICSFVLFKYFSSADCTVQECFNPGRQ